MNRLETQLGGDGRLGMGGIEVWELMQVEVSSWVEVVHAAEMGGGDERLRHVWGRVSGRKPVEE